MQILPGEIIVSYTKNCTAVPYTFNIEWADDEITEAQLEIICNELAEKSTFAKNKDGQEITDVKQWAISAVKRKAMECKKQLIVKQQNQDKSFSQEITSLAEKKLL